MLSGCSSSPRLAGPVQQLGCWGKSTLPTHLTSQNGMNGVTHLWAGSQWWPRAEWRVPALLRLDGSS